MQVKVNDFGHGLAEIGQSTRAKMAMCRKTKDGFETCHQLAKCKDFLHDAVSCMFVKGRKSNIYGFRYDPETMPVIDLDAIRVYVQGISGEDAVTSYNALSSLATSMEWDQVILTKEGAGFVFEGDKRWLNSPASISLFTGLIRMGQYGPMKGSLGEWFTEVSKLKGNDPSYVAQAGGPKAVDKMLKLLGDSSIHWDTGMYNDMPSHALHHGCGWVAYCCGLYSKGVGDGAFPVKR